MKDHTVQEMAEKYADKQPSIWHYAKKRELIIDAFLAGHSLANDRIKELEGSVDELKEYIRKAEILIETLAANDTMNDLKKA